MTISAVLSNKNAIYTDGFNQRGLIRETKRKFDASSDLLAMLELVRLWKAHSRNTRHFDPEFYEALNLDVKLLKLTRGEEGLWLHQGVWG